MLTERDVIAKDLAGHVLETFRPAMMKATDLLDNDLERAKCALVVLAQVASWAAVFFGKHHGAPPPGTPEGEKSRIEMTLAVLDLTKEIVTGEAIKKIDALRSTEPTNTSTGEEKHG